MPVTILGFDEGSGEVGRLIHLEIDREKLTEIRDELDHLAGVLKVELIEIKTNKQQKTEPGTEVYKVLKDTYNTITSAGKVLDRVTAE